jgi:hypothetical protein
VADPLFACGLVKAREERLLARVDLLRIVDGMSWEEAEQILDRGGFVADPQGVWRRSPRQWAAQIVAAEALEVASLLPDELAPFPHLRTEAHNLGLILGRLRGEVEPHGGLLPGGRIDQAAVAEGEFPMPWDRDALLWTALRDRTMDHPFRTDAACLLAASSYRRELLRETACPPLVALGEQLAAGTVISFLARARRQGRPWSMVAAYAELPETVAGGSFDAIYPLPLEEWAAWLSDPWGTLLPAALGRSDMTWEALLHELVAPLIGEAWRETLSVGPVIAWFLLREMQAAIAGYALEAKIAGLGQADLEGGVPRVFA